MKIAAAIERVRRFCKGIDAWTGLPIDGATTRDKVTYGQEHLKEECSGIVCCLWATADVIREAETLGANLIICHEALFWNHGDRQEVLSGNAVFAAKRELLDGWGGTVWRCHDYIHSGVPIDEGRYTDGIFFGFAQKMGWLDCRVGKASECMDYRIPETSGSELAKRLVCALGLNGTRITGDAEAPVSRVQIPMHVMGNPASDTEEIATIEREGIDALVTMEFCDFTVSEYIRDSALLGKGRCAITVGHFNLEEPGMECMAGWLPEALGTDAVPAQFVPMGDTYQYVMP
jgi:putative NIF3 family GTP cyclohydrolase 1 type 2